METHKFNQKRTIVPNQLGPTQNSVITPKDRPADQAQTASSTQPPTHNAGPAGRHPAPPLEKNPTCKKERTLARQKPPIPYQPIREQYFTTFRPKGKAPGPAVQPRPTTDAFDERKKQATAALNQ